VRDAELRPRETCRVRCRRPGTDSHQTRPGAPLGGTGVRGNDRAPHNRVRPSTVAGATVEQDRHGSDQDGRGRGWDAGAYRLITGCSTGLGRALAQAALARGWNAVVTARNPESIRDLVRQYPRTGSHWHWTSPTRQASHVARSAQDRFGQVDVLVNNAGHGYRAAVEEGEEAEVAELFATNFFGPVALIKAVLPSMRARRTGAVVRETAPLGIKVIVVDPGAFRTDFAGRSVQASGPGHRRLRRHGRAPPQGKRHHARPPTRRPGPRSRGDRHRPWSRANLRSGSYWAATPS
jgi:NAD(P)-dependent dehydrogenase (short-subunit alcohol dehydrogenase family)